MKIRELLLDGLINTKLFEMAFERKIAIKEARDLQLQIAAHLVKLIMYSDSLHVNHWATEVNAWLRKIQRYLLKGTNKPLDEPTLFKILFDEPLGEIADVQSRMDEAYEDYPDLEIDQPGAAEIHKELNWMLKSICYDIANRKFKGIGNY